MKIQTVNVIAFSKTPPRSIFVRRISKTKIYPPLQTFQKENLLFKNRKTIDLSIEESIGYGSVMAKGAFWNISFAIANKCITLIGQVLLAWLLTPAEMGMAGMAVAMAGFASFLGAGSIGDVLIQRRHYNDEVGQGFWLSVFFAIATGGIIASLSPVAIWMGHRELKGLLLILAFFPLADIFTPLLSAALKTNLDFKHFAISSFVSGSIYTICSLCLAFLGMGPYALIVSILPRALSFWGFMLLRTGLPKFQRPHWQIIKEMINPALSLSITGFLAGLQTQAPVFLVGIVMNSSSTGYFSWGWMVASQAVYLLALNLRQVLMPVFVKIVNDSERQISGLFKAMKALTAILTIAGGLQGLLAEPLLDKFFLAKWHLAGQVITWISMGLIFQGIYICISSWLNAVGRYRELLVVTLIPVLLTSGFTYLGATKDLSCAALGGGLGLTLGSLYPLIYLPYRQLRSNFKSFFFPLLISIFTWTVLYYFAPSSFLFLRLLFSVLFFLVSSSVWWYLDDGDLREQLKKTFFLITSKIGRKIRTNG